MCIVADKVESVNHTKICCCQVGYKIHGSNEILPAQLTVYSANVVTSAKTNALILPVYNPTNDVNTIIPLDFSKYPTFFKDIKSYFNRFDMSEKSLSYGVTKQLSKNNSLTVYYVGDYKFSIMSNKNDYSRINTNELNISPEAKVSIDVHPMSYSFIVYQFRGSGDVTPFGYLSYRDKNTLVVPTIHGHPHNETYTGSTITNVSYFENNADYDHTIYLLANTDANITAKSNYVKLTDKDYVDFSNIINKINTDFLGRIINIYLAKDCTGSIHEIEGRHVNRNMSTSSGKLSFINDIISNKSKKNDFKSMG